MANLKPNLDTAMNAILNVASIVAEATGGVYNTMAPEHAMPPYVIFQSFSKVDEYYSTTKRGADAVYMVKAVSKSRWPKEASDIDTLIDNVLQDASLSITGFTLLSCRRQEDFYLVEHEASETFQHVGGLYRIWVNQD